MALSELVTGSAYGKVQLGWVLLSLDPLVSSPRYAWATPWNDSGLSVAWAMFCCCPPNLASSGPVSSCLMVGSAQVVDALTLCLTSPTDRVGASPGKPSGPLVWEYSLSACIKSSVELLLKPICLFFVLSHFFPMGLLLLAPLGGGHSDRHPR